MASTYSTSLRLQLIATGEQAGTWGNTTNTNLGTLLEQAITGVGAITLNVTTYTLTANNGLTDQSRNAVLVFSGSPSGDCTVTAPAVAKTYIVRNNTTKNVIMSIGSGTTITVPSGITYIMYTDGTTGFYLATNYNPSNVAIIGGTIDGTTIGGTTIANGSFYDMYAYDGAFLGVNPTAQTVTISQASPAVVTLASGTPPKQNAQVSFTSTGSLPSGITSGATYYAYNIAGTGPYTFNLSTTLNGANPVNTTSGYDPTISMVINSSVTFNTPTVYIPNGFTFNSTGAITLPVGTTAQEPASPTYGMIRYNTTTGSFEGYSGTWGAIGGGSGAVAGGVVYENNKQITVSYTMTTSKNGESVGPITINPGVASQPCTITITTPGVITASGTVPLFGSTVVFATTGALPTGITAGTTYYAVNVSGSTFQIAATYGGTPIATSGTQSGTQSFTTNVKVTIPAGSRWVIL